MFQWTYGLGIQDEVKVLREWLKPLNGEFPPAVIYSLPNALWYFSGLLAFSEIWDNRREKAFWVGIFTLIAFGSELGQYLKIVSGSFDTLDILFMVASLSAFVILEKMKNENIQNKIQNE